jgi:hypothetical protein
MRLAGKETYFVTKLTSPISMQAREFSEKGVEGRERESALVALTSKPHIKEHESEQSKIVYGTSNQCTSASNTNPVNDGISEIQGSRKTNERTRHRMYIKPSLVQASMNCQQRYTQ